MKKLLLASTALVLSAGIAAAQGVSLSGDARMGIEYNDRRATGAAANSASWQMTSRARVTFTLSGESDTGLSFGASFRADNAGAAAGDLTNTGTGVFVSGAFGRLTIGNAANAARFRVGDPAFTSLTGLGDPNNMLYLDRAQQASAADLGGRVDLTAPIPAARLAALPAATQARIANSVAAFTAASQDRRTAARYDYSFDAFSLSASVDQFREYTAAGQTYRPLGLAIAAGYDFGMGNIAVGYEDLRVSNNTGPNFNAGHVTIGGDVTFEGITIKGVVGFATNDLGTLFEDIGGQKQQYGISASGTFDAITVTAFYNRDFFKTDRFGLGASYDLGGGASVVGSVAQRSSNANMGLLSNTRADFGVELSF